MRFNEKIECRFWNKNQWDTKCFFNVSEMVQWAKENNIHIESFWSIEEE